LIFLIGSFVVCHYGMQMFMRSIGGSRARYSIRIHALRLFRQIGGVFDFGTTVNQPTTQHPPGWPGLQTRPRCVWADYAWVPQWRSVSHFPQLNLLANYPHLESDHEQ
jgi:hypothetical protein